MRAVLRTIALCARAGLGNRDRCRRNNRPAAPAAAQQQRSLSSSRPADTRRTNCSTPATASSARSRAGWRSVIEKAVSQWGLPNGYVLGQEAGGAFVAGLRYGEGTLYTKNAGDLRVFWQGPSLGFDFGGEGARTMMLVYSLPATEAIYQRFAGIDGSAYFVGGFGMTALDGEQHRGGSDPLRRRTAARRQCRLSEVHAHRRPGTRSELPLVLPLSRIDAARFMPYKTAAVGTTAVRSIDARSGARFRLTSAPCWQRVPAVPLW